MKTVANVPAEYCSLADRLGTRANDFWAAYINHRRFPTFKPIDILKTPIKELPQVRP